jgi:hypothetical protein
MEGDAMARILFDGSTLEVSEDVEETLKMIVNSRDGLRRGSGAIIAPAGWVVLSTPGGEPVYVQVARIACVRED